MKYLIFKIFGAFLSYPSLGWLCFQFVSAVSATNASPCGCGDLSVRLGSRISPHRHRHRVVVEVHWRGAHGWRSISWVVATFNHVGGSFNCQACRTTLVATRFRVAVICPIIQVPHCIRVFFYFVWFVFTNHIFQFHYELCTYCNILDIYLS